MTAPWHLHTTEDHPWADEAPDQTPVMITCSEVLSPLPLLPECCTPSIYYNNWSNKMRTAPIGTLLKSQTVGRSTLSNSPQSRRLTEHLHDLITIAYEQSTNRRSNSLNLTRLEYVIGEKPAGKFCMHFAGLVREADRLDGVPILVTFTVEEDHNG